MKIGIFAMLSEKTIDPVSAAQRCEELGFESFWVPEHAIIPILAPVLERANAERVLEKMAKDYLV